MHIISIEIPVDSLARPGNRMFSFQTNLCTAILERGKTEGLPLRYFKMELIEHPERDIATSWGGPEETFFRCQAERAKSYELLLKVASPDQSVIVFDGYYQADREWQAAFAAIQRSGDHDRLSAFVKQRPHAQNGTSLASRLGIEYALRILCVNKRGSPNAYATRFGTDITAIHLCRADLRLERQFDLVFNRIRGLPHRPA